MKINIVCYEDPDQWICGKIARRLTESLCKLGHDCVLGRAADPAAQINHHVIYLTYDGFSTGINTLMVTHIDNAVKLRRLEEGLKTAHAAICMSREAVESLQGLGLDGGKLGHAHIAHDGGAMGRKFVVGLTTRLYPDGRKKEDHLVRLLDFISPEDFRFQIMGYGWGDIVASMRSRGFTVAYHEDFDAGKYRELLAGLDYYLYLATDEGSAGFIDALAAGVKTIVTPQGFHLDAPGGITHPITDFDSLRNTFTRLADERRQRVAAVANWTWDNYARMHLEIWASCLAGDAPGGGRMASPPPSGGRVWGRKLGLWANYVAQRLKMVARIRGDYDCQSRIWNTRRPPVSEAQATPIGDPASVEPDGGDASKERGHSR